MESGLFVCLQGLEASGRLIDQNTECTAHHIWPRILLVAHLHSNKTNFTSLIPLACYLRIGSIYSAARHGCAQYKCENIYSNAATRSLTW